MDKLSAKKMAYDLTMEYVRQHKDLLPGNIEVIPDKISIIEKVYNTFYDNLIFNKNFKGLD